MNSQRENTINKIKTLGLSDDVMKLVNEQLTLIEEYVDAELDDDVDEKEKATRLNKIRIGRNEVLFKIRSMIS